jgi:hypothetical protein
MDAGQREGGQQKTRFSHIRRAGHIARTLRCRFLSDRILAPCERHLGCPSQVAGPCIRGPLLMPNLL